MIPRIIHQTWKNSHVPGKFISYQEKVRQLHPDWKYILWTDHDNLEFIKKNFPDFLSIYNNYPENIMRADIIRYFIMYKLGGLYLDLDYEMIRTFDLTDYDLVLPYNRNKSFGDDFDGLGNCIFASAPGHPFWKYVLDDCKKERDYERFFRNLSKKAYITHHTTLEEAITGPGLITRVFYSSIAKLENYHLPQRQLFHPITPRGRLQYDKIINNGVSYGIHHISGSWRNKSIIKKVQKRVKRFFIGKSSFLL